MKWKEISNFKPGLSL